MNHDSTAKSRCLLLRLSSYSYHEVLELHRYVTLLREFFYSNVYNTYCIPIGLRSTRGMFLLINVTRNSIVITTVC